MNALHDLVADQLERAEPAAREALLRIPLENIARWLANGCTAPHRLEQRRVIIQNAQQSPEGFTELLRLLRGRSEGAVHLKSFGPFSGGLTTLELREVLLLCAHAHGINFSMTNRPTRL